MFLTLRPVEAASIPGLVAYGASRTARSHRDLVDLHYFFTGSRDSALSLTAATMLLPHDRRKPDFAAGYGLGGSSYGAFLNSQRLEQLFRDFVQRLDLYEAFVALHFGSSGRVDFHFLFLNRDRDGRRRFPGIADTERAVWAHLRDLTAKLNQERLAAGEFSIGNRRKKSGRFHFVEAEEISPALPPPAPAVPPAPLDAAAPPTTAPLPNADGDVADGHETASVPAPEAALPPSTVPINSAATPENPSSPTLPAPRSPSMVNARAEMTAAFPLSPTPLPAEPAPPLAAPPDAAPLPAGPEPAPVSCTATPEPPPAPASPIGPSLVPAIIPAPAASAPSPSAPPPPPAPPAAPAPTPPTPRSPLPTAPATQTPAPAPVPRSLPLPSRPPAVPAPSSSNPATKQAPRPAPLPTIASNPRPPRSAEEEEIARKKKEAEEAEELLQKRHRTLREQITLWICQARLAQEDRNRVAELAIEAEDLPQRITAPLIQPGQPPACNADEAQAFLNRYARSHPEVSDAIDNLFHWMIVIRYLPGPDNAPGPAPEVRIDPVP